MKTCIICNNVLSGRQRKFCSSECEKKSVATRSVDLYKKRLKQKICKLCDTEFLGKDKQVNCDNCKGKKSKAVYKTHIIETKCPDCSIIWKKEIKNSTKKSQDIILTVRCKKCLSKLYSNRMKENNPMFNKETYKNMLEHRRSDEKRLYLIEETNTLEFLSFKEYMSKKSKKNYENGMYSNFKYTPTELDREKSSNRMKENNPMFNEETRIKVSETKKLREYEYKRGKEHHLYKGTRTRSNYVRLSLKSWIKDNLIRSDYTCEVCGVQGGTLEVHHLSEPLRECIIRCLDGKDINALSGEEFENFRELVAKEHDNITGLVCCIPCHREVDSYRH